LPLLAHGSALRFLLTRLHDWITIRGGALVQNAILWNTYKKCASTAE
jgi:hypothetical protein